MSYYILFILTLLNYHIMTDLSDILFENINNNYSYGAYGDFKVIIMKKNNYINATKLCNENNKRYEHWSRNASNEELINEVKKEINHSKSLTTHIRAVNDFDDNDTNFVKPIIVIKGGGKITQISGTYVHPLLIPHIASWISPKFGIKVSKIVNEYIINEYKNKLLENNNKLAEKEMELAEKKQENISLTNKMDILLKKMDEQNKKMDEQTIQMNEQTKQMNEQTKDTKQLKIQNKKQMSKLNKQSEQLTELQITVGKISSKLDSCAHMPDNNELSDRFVVMKSEEDYYVIRAQDRNIYNAIKRQEDKGYKRISDLIESETIPNSIYLWNTIKDELIKENKIKTFRNTFKLQIPESDFITIVKSIFDQRKEYN